jgi:hypothetical protein
MVITPRGDTIARMRLWFALDCAVPSRRPEALGDIGEEGP